MKEVHNDFLIQLKGFLDELIDKEDLTNPRPGYLTDLQSLWEQTDSYMNNEPTINELRVVEWEDLEQNIVDEIDRLQREDILERYDQGQYHDQDIIHNTLAEHGIKLPDNSKKIWHNKKKHQKS